MDEHLSFKHSATEDSGNLRLGTEVCHAVFKDALVLFKDPIVSNSVVKNLVFCLPFYLLFLFQAISASISKSERALCILDKKFSPLTLLKKEKIHADVLSKSKFSLPIGDFSKICEIQ